MAAGAVFVKRIKVLQVVGALNAGGTETWLIQMPRHVRSKRLADDIAIDFLVHNDANRYADEAAALGSRILQCEHPRRIDY